MMIKTIVNPVLEENFYTSPKKGSFFQVKLSERCLSLVKSSGNAIKTRIISLDDVVGCKCSRRRQRMGEKCHCHPKQKNIFPFLEDAQDEMDCSAYLHVYCYILKNYLITSGQRRERFKITLRFRHYKRYEDNLKDALKWKFVLKQLVAKSLWYNVLFRNISNNDNNVLQANETLFVLNPKSGAGKAKEMFRDRIKPILMEADLNHDLYVTRAQHDARNLVKTSNLLKWRKGIIAIGGDGVLYEIINGVMERPDWKHIINTIPFGIMPCGSGNGLAKSLSVCTEEPYDDNPVLVSALNIIKGYPVPVDLVRIETHSEVVFSLLSFGWGLIADIDIESERLRVLGSPRFTIWSVARLIGLRTYTGRLSFLRVPPERVKEVVASSDYVEINVRDAYPFDEDADDKKSTLNLECDSNSSFDMESISLDTGCNQSENDGVKRAESFYSLNSHRSAYHSDKESSYLSLPEITKSNKRTVHGPSSMLPPLNKPVSKLWEVHQGEFVMVHASYQSHLAGDVFFAPGCKPNDGIIWLLVVKAGISRVKLLQFLLGLSNGSHLKCPNVEMIPVLAFRLEPLCTGSHIVVDGEILEHSPIVQAEIFPGLISLFNRPNPPKNIVTDPPPN